jgi:excisionase family DNA binding protein
MIGEVTLATGSGGSELLNLAELARYLGMAERTIYVWAQQGKNPAFKIGSAWRFRRTDIDAWLETQRSGPVVGDMAPLTDPVEPPASKFRIREREKQARRARMDECRADILAAMRAKDGEGFDIDQFADRFGRDVVDAVVEQLSKEKTVEVGEIEIKGEKVRYLKERR